MILSILFMVLIIIGISMFLFFLFVLFLPSLVNQKIDATDLMFSKEELDAVHGLEDFKWSKKRVDYTNDRESSLFFARYQGVPEPSEADAERNEKLVKRWSGLYERFYKDKE